MPPNNMTALPPALMLHLPDARATDALGMQLSTLLTTGDCVLLEGDLGAGKSTLARAIIQTALKSNEPVPSPTFTLTAHYETESTFYVHADLYRMSGPEELEETGLDEAFQEAVTLVEWPDRLGDSQPVDALMIGMAIDGEGRKALVSASGERSAAILSALGQSRETQLSDFLAKAGFDEATAVPGDASNRRYFHTGPHIAMDAPYAKGEDVRPFVAVTEMLRQRGLSAPDILAADEANGFLLLENLGEGLFARLCEADPGQESALYTAAVDLLHGLGTQETDRVPNYDMAVLEREVMLLTDWWCPAAGMTVSDDMRAEWAGVVHEAMAGVAEDRSALVLRDYHAENLLWLPERQGNARVGLLDYQDALIGHPAYDLVSLLEDARRDVSPGLAEAMIARFLERRGDLDGSTFRREYDLLGAQRNAKIVGIFARLCVRDSKPRYLSMIPRVWAHLMRDIRDLSGLRGFIERHVPAPDGDVLARMKAEYGR